MNERKKEKRKEKRMKMSKKCFLFFNFSIIFFIILDLAQHIFVKHGVTALRRARKTDNVRIARISGATIVSRPDELQESDVGKEAGLFEVRKIGDE